MSGNSFSKVVIVFLAISLFFSLMPDSAKATSTQMKVTSDSLNVRSKPGTQYSKIGAFKKNQVVTVIEHQNGWSKVAYGKSYGCVSSSYLSPLTWNGYVNASSLSLRKAASTSSQSLASLPMGTILTVEGQQGSWLKVYVPSKKLRLQRVLVGHPSLT